MKTFENFNTYKSILNTNQQNAVNSGITSTKVSQYDGYNTLPDYVHFNIDSNQNTMEYVIRNYKPSYSVTLTRGKTFTINNVDIPECGAYICITYVLYWGDKTYTTIIPGYGSYTKYILIEEDRYARKGANDNYALKDDYKDWIKVRTLGYLSYNKSTKTLTLTESTGDYFFGPSSSYPHKLEVWNIANSFNLTEVVHNKEISYNVYNMNIGTSKNVTLPYYKVLSASYLRVEYDGGGYDYTVSNFSTTSTSVSFKVTRSSNGGYKGTYARVIFSFSGIE